MPTADGTVRIGVSPDRLWVLVGDVRRYGDNMNRIIEQENSAGG